MSAEQVGEPDEIIATLQQLVEPEGAKLELADMDVAHGRVSLRLVLDGVDCPECVLSRDYLEGLSLNLIGRSHPWLTQVSVEDPRER